MTIARANLESRHGTYAQFEAAVWNAVGEISVDEARNACEKYRTELEAADQNK